MQMPDLSDVRTRRGMFFLVILVLGALGYTFYTLTTTLSEVRREAEHTKLEMQAEIDRLSLELNSTTQDRNMLSEFLQDEKNKNNLFQEQIQDIAGTVGVLDKLSKTDEELLQKYSKVYFLNEHYTPENLEKIDNEYVYDEVSRNYFLHEKVMPFLEDMLEDAKDDDIKIWVTSAFRSFDEQADLKGKYTVTYGSGANTFSADQGYSEHQLGTAVDFTTTGLGGGLDGFGETEAFRWLEKNAHRYGFTLSYPRNNGYYVYEPWHWRFVGRDLADDLHDEDKYFYDLEQRDINEYLISIFD